MFSSYMCMSEKYICPVVVRRRFVLQKQQYNMSRGSDFSEQYWYVGGEICVVPPGSDNIV